LSRAIGSGIDGPFGRKWGIREKNVQHKESRHEDGRFLQDAQSLAGSRIDPPLYGNPDRGRPHALALDGCGYSEGPKGEGSTEAGTKETLIVRGDKPTRNRVLTTVDLEANAISIRVSAEERELHAN
jgi:hypothetical protein